MVFDVKKLATKKLWQRKMHEPKFQVDTYPAGLNSCVSRFV